MKFRSTVILAALAATLFMAWDARRARVPNFKHRSMPSLASDSTVTVSPGKSATFNAPSASAVPFNEQAAEAKSAASVIPEPRFARFAEWLERYTAAAPELKSALETEGIELARRRRDEMADLIQSHPDRALELAVRFGARQGLPESIEALLEKPVSGRGSLTVLAALPEPGREGEIPPVTRSAEINGEIYQAFVYGRRLGEPSRDNISLHGVALKGSLALHENPARILDAEEAAFRKSQLAASAEAVCEISGQPTSSRGEETAVDVGGELTLLCGPAHAHELNEQLVAAESGEGSLEGIGSTAASAYTEGTKNLIVIRVDFEDLAGAPFSGNEGVELIEGLNVFYREMSYGKTGFALADDGSEITPAFRMPHSAAYYGTRDATVLRRDARAAATAAGYKLGSFHFDVIAMGAVPGFRWSGLGAVGAAGAWIRNTWSVGVTAHELGHNLGLNHANFWDTAGQSVIGTGKTLEYEDKFDTMGSANAGRKHFNARYKSYLNWLTTNDVVTVAQSGTYRIFPHDDPDATGVRALRIPKNGGTNYWVEFRARYTGNKWLASGVGLRWAGNGNQSTRLLDLTPGSPDGKDDSCLLIGRTFSDPAAGLHITAVGKTTSPEAIDVVVNKGSFTDNVSPVLSLDASGTSASLNTELAFTATASDANGDTLAYFWDFGDGSLSENNPGTRHRWSAVGEYLVQCTVTDMKGGEARASVAVRVGSPNTFRIAGRVQAEGQPLQGVRVAATSTRMTFTDSDGRYTLAGLPAGSYTLKAVREGYVLGNPDFSNPVRVGPSREGIDFVAVQANAQNTISIVAAGSKWRFLDDGSDQGTAWREPGFDDSGWSNGPAPLGYGDDGGKTVVSFGPDADNKHVTTYFRHAFTIDDPKRFSSVTLGLRRDDGGVVHLNGREIFRSNVFTDVVDYLTPASTTVGGADEGTFFEGEIDPALLRAGTNVFAVEIHQVAPDSSDIVFDLELLGIAVSSPAPPALAWEISGGNLKLNWPDGSAAWTLYAASNLSPGAAWLPVSVSTSTVNGRRFVTFNLSEAERYYRLRKP